MKNYVGLILCILSCCFFFSTPTLGCSLGIAPITKFNPHEYVFIGQVMGIVGPFESKKFRGKAWGLQVKVEEEIYLPNTPTSYFEVFTFSLWADCSSVGVSKEELTQEFAIGSRIKVIAMQARLLPDTLDSSTIRLEMLPGTWGDVSRNYFEDGKQMVDAQSVFDYKSFKQVSPEEYVENFMPFLDAKIVIPRYELRKDMLRLTNAKSEAEKIQILERLVYYPIQGGGLSYYELARSYIEKLSVVEMLNGKREAWINETNGDGPK